MAAWNLIWKKTSDEKHEIAILEFNVPGEKVNTLNIETMEDLSSKLAEVEYRKPAALVITSAKKEQFIAGADINLIRSLKTAEEAANAAKVGQSIFSRIEKLNALTVAAVNGSAMGGGLELPLSCNVILASDSEKVRLALPEVQLGVLPGFGGTQRLPRKIGLVRSLDLLLTGKALRSSQAKQLGLVDEVLPKENFSELILPWVEKELKSPKDRKPKLSFTEKLLGGIGKSILFSQAGKKVLAQTKGQYPSPLKILEVLKKTAALSPSQRDKGYEIEATAFGELAVTEVSKSLIAVFFLMERAKKIDGVRSGTAESKKVTSTAVVGAGVMGGGIAWLFSKYDYPVLLKDINTDALELGIRSAKKVYQAALKRRKMTRADYQRKIARITPTLSYSGFKGIDYVVEAVVENMGVKKKVLADLEEALSEEAIITTNTSTLSITKMTAEAKHPERIAGMHFFNPVHKMPLVEIIRGEKTSDQTIKTIVELTRRCGKTPVVVNDGAGFLVNRILGPFLCEASYFLEEGVDFTYVDRALSKFGMPMGAYRLLDEVGIDVAIKASKVMHEELGERLATNDLLNQFVEKKWLGRKTGKGFFAYSDDPKAKPVPDKSIYQLFKIKLLSPSAFPSEEEVVHRSIYSMINEAARCLEDQIVTDPDDIDTGVIFGLGFPPFRGGLMKYADSVGISNIVKTLEDLQSRCGMRFEPAPLLKKLVSEGKTFASLKNK